MPISSDHSQQFTVFTNHYPSFHTTQFQLLHFIRPTHHNFLYKAQSVQWKLSDSDETAENQETADKQEQLTGSALLSSCCCDDHPSTCWTHSTTTEPLAQLSSPQYSDNSHYYYFHQSAGLTSFGYPRLVQISQKKTYGINGAWFSSN